MNSSSSSRPSPPLQRELKSPYFLFRTPDGLGSYFSAENLPLVASPKEPLSRFLAPARLAENGLVRTLRYDVSAVPLDSARPMDYLPQSEIDAFAEAAKAFYARAHAAAARVVPHEKRLRAHFRLPDPDLEPDAYWVYGPSHDRRLLIFWGAELKAGTSLALAPDDELRLASGRTLLDRLQARVMTWEARQKEALRFAQGGDEPIARFLARPAVDSAGTPVGVSCQGRTFAAKKLRPLRRIYMSECAAFERAARAFYDRGEARGTGAYEKEIRQAFRLPDPDAAIGAYFVIGKRMVIAVNGGESRDATLPLIAHPLVPTAPAAIVAAEGAGEGPIVVAPAPGVPRESVAAKLRARSISAARVNSLAAAAALALIGAGWGAWKLAVDHTPPRVVESADYPAATGERGVVVKFSKAIDPRTIQGAAPAKPAFTFGDDAANVESARLDPKDPSRVLLATSPLDDGKTYRLTVDSVADRAGNPLPEATSVSFKYLDATAPEIQTVSAGENANQLLLVFSKPVAEASAARAGSYSVFALEAGGEGPAQRIVSAHLDPEDKAGRTVILEAVRDFVGNQPYRLESIAGVTDRSVSRNPVALPAKGLDFPYRDVLPPRIRGISASASLLELTVGFSKPVDPKIAQDLGNYHATGPEKTPLNFLPGSAALDATGRNLTLRLEPSRLSRGIYHLNVAAMSDRMGNATAGALAAAFEFADPDQSTLKVTGHSLVASDNHVDNKVTLTFNRALDPEGASRVQNFTVMGAGRTASDLAVVEARRVPEDPSQVILILSQSPTPGVKILIHIAGLADIFGEKASGAIEYALTPPGIPDLSENVLDWLAPPTLRGNELALTIKEAVSRSSALDARNYVFSPADARVDGVVGYEIVTDPKSGSRRTLVRLRVEVPTADRPGLTLRARDLRAAGLEFLGAQRLRPLEVALQ